MSFDALSSQNFPPGNIFTFLLRRPQKFTDREIIKPYHYDIEQRGWGALVMPMPNKLTPKGRLAALPHSVEIGIQKLGQNLRAARLRRNLSIEDVATRIGVSPFAVADAEKGKPSTGVAVYAALLWTYRLLDQLTETASPTKDTEGAALSLSRKRARTPRPRTLSNDF